MTAMLLTAVLLVPAAPPTATPNPELQAAIRLLRQGDAQAARTALEPLARDDDPEAVYWLGQAQLAAGDYDAAIETLERAIGLDGRNARFQVAYGSALIEKTDHVGRIHQLFLARKARSAFERAVELDPKDIGARWALLRYESEAPGIAGGSTSAAFEQARALEALDPAQGRQALAMLHARAGDWESAEKVYREALAADPADTDSAIGLGIVLQQRKKWDEAFATFEAVLAREPAQAAALYQVGRTGALSGLRLDRAAEALRAYLAADPGPGDPPPAAARWRLGMVLEKAGDREGARREYEASLALQPDFEEARKALDALGKGS